jgi:hypothetical protein
MGAQLDHPRIGVRRFVAGTAAALSIASGPLLVAPAMAAEPTPPEILFAGDFIMGPVATDHLMLLITEPIDSTSIPDPADFTWHAIVPGPISNPPPPIPPDVPATGLTFLYEGLAYAPDFLFPTGMSLLRLDLGATVDPAATVYLTYTPGTQPIRDLEGTPMAPFAGIGGGFLDEPILADDIVPIVDDGRGPDHVLLTALQPFDVPLVLPADFEVTIDGVGHDPISVKRQIPGSGLGVIDLGLDVSIDADDPVEVSYAPTGPPLLYLTGEPVPPFTDIEAVVSLPATPSRATPAGSNVVVAPTDSSTGASTVTVTFGQVTSAGTTTVASSSIGPQAPAGFVFGDPPLFVDVDTTAAFTNASICFDYDPTQFSVPESALRLLHFEDPAWVDATAAGSPDVTNHRICGTVTSFSPFAVAGLVPFPFTGFFSPVDNAPVRNGTKAGSAIPLKFGLGGDRGLGVLAPGSPSSQAVACDSGLPIDQIEQTAMPGAATLSYDPGSSRYTYVWKTDKNWTGCRHLALTLIDGTTHSATFQFR